MNEEQEVTLLEEIKDLQKGITAILVAIGKIETEMRQLSSMSVKLEATEKTVIRLERDLVTAFKKIDELQEQIDDLEDQIVSDKKASKDDKKWLWGAVMGLAAFAVTLWKVLQP